MKTRVVNSRLRLLLLVILLTFAALGARTAWLQTVRASSLAAMAQTQAKKSIVLPAGRGTIYDRLGNPLASHVLFPVYVAAFYTPLRSLRANLGVVASLAIGLVIATAVAAAKPLTDISSSVFAWIPSIQPDVR